MKIKEVSEKFKLSMNKAYRIADIMEIEIKGGEYVFPDDFVPIYIPDGREYKNIKDDPRAPYVYMMDVIAKRMIAYDGYLSLDESIRKTIVRELNIAKFIVLIEGRKKDSLDYRDYIVSLTCNNWFDRKAKKRLEIMNESLRAIARGAFEGTFNQ